MKVLKIRGTTRWNVNKSITTRDPFLSLAEKHHVAKVTKGDFYGCFRCKHGEERKCVQKPRQTRWTLFEGVFLALETVKRWKNWWQSTSFEIQAIKRSLSPKKAVKMRLNSRFVVSDRLRTDKQAMTVSDDEVEENLFSLASQTLDINHGSILSHDTERARTEAFDCGCRNKATDVTENIRG